MRNCTIEKYVKAMWEMISEDPFHASGAAEYEVLEFQPARVTAGIEERLRPS